MVVITGRKPYGKCDAVPELFYVSTWFFHFDYIPLVPMGTRLILGQQGDMYRVVKIPFSAKSLLLAWGRAAGVLAASVGWLLAVIAMSDQRFARDNGRAGPLAFAVAATVATVLLFVCFRKASYKRACQLAQYTGLTERGWAALNVLYGREPAPGPVDATFGARG